MNEEQLLEDISRTIGQKCESQTVEVKAAGRGTPKLYETLSSFSNQPQGGLIIFGLSEEQGFKATGVFDPQKLQSDIAEQCKEMSPELHPVLIPVQIDGVTVVGAYIEGLLMNQRPCYRKTQGIIGGSYVLVGDQDQRMPAAMLYEIEAFKKGARDDAAASEEAELSMLDPVRVSQYVRRAQEDRPNLARRDADEVLALTGAQRDGHPTLAGLLTLSDYPQQIYPNLCITAIAVAGTRIEQDADNPRFLDSKRFEGPIDQMIEGARGFVLRNTRMKVSIENGSRRDTPEYPAAAVREIIINSLMHRDYSAYNNGTPVRLAIFSDRLECWNPGGIYGGQSVEELGHSNLQTRNATLVSMLEVLGIAENRHSGIPAIRDAMRRAGLRPPVFVDDRGSFTAKLYNEPEEEEGARPAAGDKVAVVLEYCTVPRSRAEIAAELGIGAAYAGQTIIAPLVAEGRLAMTMPDKPKSKHQRFITIG